MNTLLTRASLAITSAVLVAGCGTAASNEAIAPAAAVPEVRTEALPGGTYDGWIVRARRDAAPPACPWSPDRVERLLESDAPLPACVRRTQRWFEERYDGR